MNTRDEEKKFHDKLIFCIKALGYAFNSNEGEEGVCLGSSCLMLQASISCDYNTNHELQDPLELFDKRLTYIKNILFPLIKETRENLLQTKKYAKLHTKDCPKEFKDQFHEEIREITKKQVGDEIYNDINVFFNALLIYAQPQLYDTSLFSQQFIYTILNYWRKKTFEQLLLPENFYSFKKNKELFLEKFRENIANVMKKNSKIFIKQDFDYVERCFSAIQNYNILFVESFKEFNAPATETDIHLSSLIGNNALLAQHNSAMNLVECITNRFTPVDFFNLLNSLLTELKHHPSHSSFGFLVSSRTHTIALSKMQSYDEGYFYFDIDDDDNETIVSFLNPTQCTNDLFSSFYYKYNKDTELIINLSFFCSTATVEQVNAILRRWINNNPFLLRIKEDKINIPDANGVFYLNLAIDFNQIDLAKIILPQCKPIIT